MTEAKRKKTAAAERRETVDVICAFCGGKGRDPFDIMSPLADCQVCGGPGHHTLHQPIATCAFCQGTGVHPGSRNTCTTCRGIGMVEVTANAITCPCCVGSGRAANVSGQTAHYPVAVVGAKGSWLQNSRRSNQCREKNWLRLWNTEGTKRWLTADGHRRSLRERLWLK